MFSRPSDNLKACFETKTETNAIAIAKRLLAFPDVRLYTIVAK